MPARIVLAIGLLFFVYAAVGSGHVPVREAWDAARYNGPGNAVDAASALAVDEAGNIYVTGGSVGAGTGPFDYATAKYDRDGNELWVARYNGPGNAWDFARSVAVDAAGNVYVTGESTGAGTFFDYATVKYDANGNELWIARYTSEGFADDSAIALAVDAASDVYVTGRSADPTSGLSDYATVKYDALGNELWVTRYDGPANRGDAARALAVDAAGHVYVTGESAGVDSGLFDYATVKYAAEGTELWAARYSGPGFSSDTAVAVAVDAVGSVYVTGQSVDDNTGRSDYATVKYGVQGQELWVARREGAARALAVDSASHAYVTGSSTGAGGDSDYTTIKYDAEGSERWVAHYDGPGNADDLARALDVDAAGAVYVTGASLGDGSGLDYATVKYDAHGELLWVARYNGPGNASDAATALRVDAGGSVYVTGQSHDAGSDFDYATVKYVQPDPPEHVVLTVRRAGIGRGVVTSRPSGIHCGADCEQSYASGSIVTLSARPAFGSFLIGWRGCDTVSRRTCIVTMNSDRTVIAYFFGIPFIALDEEP